MALPKIETPIYNLIVPSTKKKINYRPFLVKEEKILLMAMESREESEMAAALIQVINNCILEESFDINEIALFDIEYVFLQIRSKSVGELAEPVIKCEKCEGEVQLSVDVSKVKVKFNKKHNKNIKLNKNIGVTMKYPDIIEMVSGGFLTAKEGSSESIEKVYNLVKDCIESIYTDDERFYMRDSSEEEKNDFMESLGTEQFKKIQEFFETMPSLTHNEKYKCPACNHEDSVTLRGLSDFFI